MICETFLIDICISNNQCMLKVPVSSDVFIQRYTVILIAKVYHVEVGDELVNK